MRNIKIEALANVCLRKTALRFAVVLSSGTFGRGQLHEEYNMKLNFCWLCFETRLAGLLWIFVYLGSQFYCCFESLSVYVYVYICVCVCVCVCV